MAKGKAKLRVIAGGGKPARAVVTTSTRPAAPPPGRLQVRAVPSKRAAEPAPREARSEDLVEQPEETALAPKTELPRFVIFAAIAIAIAGAAYFFTRRPTHTTQPAPPTPLVSATEPTDWASQPLPPAPSPSASP